MEPNYKAHPFALMPDAGIVPSAVHAGERSRNRAESSLSDTVSDDSLRCL